MSSLSRPGAWLDSEQRVRVIAAICRILLALAVLAALLFPLLMVAGENRSMSVAAAVNSPSTPSDWVPD